MVIIFVLLINCFGISVGIGPRTAVLALGEAEGLYNSPRTNNYANTEIINQ